MGVAHVMNITIQKVWRSFAILIAALMISLVTAMGGVAAAGTESAPTKIVVGLPGGSAAHAQDILERFREQNPDIVVEPLILGWTSFFEKLPLMLVSGVAPDVWYGESGRALGWYEYGFTEDLKPYVERDLDTDEFFFLDAAEDPNSGAWTGIPSDFQVTSLFYNTAHFDASGLPFPDETWSIDHMNDAAKKLTVPGDLETMRWGFNMQPEYITAGWMMWMKMLGGSILDETRTQSRLDSPQNTEALDSMLSMIYEQRISPAPGLYGFAPWEAAVSFQEGRSSMMFNIYSWNRSLREVGMETYNVAIPPVGTTGQHFTTAVPNVWVINADSSDAKREAAWRWVKFQIGEEAQRIRMASGSGVPVSRAVAFEFAELPGPPTNRRVYLDSYAFAGTLEENAVWEEYRMAIEAELLPVWAEEITPEAGLQNADREVRQILQELQEGLS